jgi:2-oxoisovalerate dehydrogenase E1 component alpha subunit
LKLRKEANICVVYFGDGAASEGDASVALNFAAVRKSRTLFYCRNNRYAISTPLSEQFVGTSIAIRGVAFGMPALKFDGNDFLATYAATSAAREKILKEETPVFLEAMTYRLAGHSTNDDPDRYIDHEERAHHKLRNPIDRTINYLKKHDLLDFDVDEFNSITRKEVLAARKLGRAGKYGSWDQVFEDVYDEPTAPLLEQREELRIHLEKHWDKYGDSLAKLEKEATLK